MSALKAVFKILQDNAHVAAKVGARRFPTVLPQQSAMPSLVLTMVDEIDARHLLGSNRYPVARFVVDCISYDYWEADDLGERVKDALIDYRGTVVGFRVDDIGHDGIDFFDKGEAGEHHRRRLSFAMRYRALELVDDDEDSPPAS